PAKESGPRDQHDAGPENEGLRQHGQRGYQAGAGAESECGNAAHGCIENEDAAEEGGVADSHGLSPLACRSSDRMRRRWQRRWMKAITCEVMALQPGSARLPAWNRP